MALSRRASGRLPASIWPGFVDAMTALILVLFFVLSVFMIVQFVLRDTITGKENELDQMSLQVANLADALGLERTRADTQEALVTTLTGQQQDAEAQIADFEAQVAGLIARNTDLGADLEAARTQSAERLSASEALEVSLASARSEMDAQEEAARLAAARREALEALVASLETDKDSLQANVAGTEAELAEAEAAARALEAGKQGLQAEVEARDAELSEAEAARLAEAAAAEALRERLKNSDAELTAMTLSLEAERKRAEETLTLLAAAEAAKQLLEGAQTEALSEAEKNAAVLAQAQALLAAEQETSGAGQRQIALLNQQTAELRGQLDSLQGLLDQAEASDVASKVQIEKLGSNLNSALARVASEQKRLAEEQQARAEAEAQKAAVEKDRADLEAREKERLAEEARDLKTYRSEFFGRMRVLLGDREGVRVVGDRFVFDSEVLFPPGSATLGFEGREQVSRVARVLNDVAGQIPAEIDWILRVDGHTDKTPLSPGRSYRDNWELSQARALSVVRYMIGAEGIPADRLAAAGFGEFQPVDPGDDAEALARNRRIEIKFTER